MKTFHAAVFFGVIAMTGLMKLSGSSSEAVDRSKSVADRVKEYGSAARSRLKPAFHKAEVSYPPKRVVFVGIKAEKRLEVYAAGADGSARLVHTYPILAASGGPGPKLREGDRQVPEGIYPIESLNPNSRFHLSLRVGYPNASDRAQASAEGRTKLGGDIMIHGNAVSIGCLAMGDPAAEELFVLAADTGVKNITVILTPVDFRKGVEVPSDTKLPPWTKTLYDNVRKELAKLPAK